MESVLTWLLENIPALAVAAVWIRLERQERKAIQARYENLSERSTHLISTHTLDVAERERRFSRERVEMEKRHSEQLNRREEHHMLLLDSSLRNAQTTFVEIFEKLSKRLTESPYSEEPFTSLDRHDLPTEPPPPPRAHLTPQKLPPPPSLPRNLPPQEHLDDDPPLERPPARKHDFE